MSFNQESPKKNFELDTEGWTEVTLPKSSSFRIEATSRVNCWVESTAIYSKYHCHDVDPNWWSTVILLSAYQNITKMKITMIHLQLNLLLLVPLATKLIIRITLIWMMMPFIQEQIWINNHNVLTYHDIIVLKLILLLLHY